MAHRGVTTKADIPHFYVPFHYMGGKPIVVDQDSYEDVYISVQNIARYPKGFREDLPEFGVTPLELTVVTDAETLALEAEIEEWESRIPIHTELHQELEDLVANVAVKVGDPGA